MSTRLRLLLDWGGQKFVGGDVKRIVASMLDQERLPVDREKLRHLPEIRSALKELATKGIKTRLLVVREPRKVKRNESLYWEARGGKKKRKYSTFEPPRRTRRVLTQDQIAQAESLIQFIGQPSARETALGDPIHRFAGGYRYWWSYIDRRWHVDLDTPRAPQTGGVPSAPTR